MGSPPKKQETDKGGARKYLLIRRKSLWIWCASSLVLAMTNACPVTYLPTLSVTNVCNTEMTNTIVFPVPDFDWQIKSLPCNAKGMARDCT